MAIDASIGTITANSYVTEEEAEAYFAERSHSSKWSVVAEKEPFLITCSRMLDWNLTFLGVKTSDVQSMQFPRSGILFASGNEYPSDIIPNEVKFAVFELILSFLSSDRTSDSSLAGIDQVKAGPLFVKATPGGYGSTKPTVIPDHVRRILIDFISSSSISVVRLMRA
jgi:hypothetical protein